MAHPSQVGIGFVRQKSALEYFQASVACAKVKRTGP
jgi:hypothetical protein